MSELDRLTAAPIAMAALLADGATADGDPDEVGRAVVVARTGGVLAGFPVFREVFGRMGVRCRPLRDEGSRLEPGDEVAELGGPTAAMRGAWPTARRLLERASAIASGALAADTGDPLDEHAARLSPPGAVGHDEPSFELRIGGDPSAARR